MSEELYFIEDVGILCRAKNRPKQGIVEWWISGLTLDPLFFLKSRLNYASFPLVISLKIN